MSNSKDHKITVPNGLRSRSKRIEPSMGDNQEQESRENITGQNTIAETPKERSALFQQLAAEQEELHTRGKEPSSEHLFDDPNFVPHKTTLADDEVPNLPGAILRHAREMLGLSQNDIAIRLKIRVNSIADLEHDRLNQPTAVNFARKHLANYARLVNIDPNAIIELYNQNVAQAVDLNNSNKSLSKLNDSSRVPKNKSIYLLLLAVLIIILGVVLYITDDSNQEYETKPLVIEEGQLNNNSSTETGDLSQEIVAEEGSLNAPDNESVSVSDSSGQIKVDRNTQLANEQALALGTNDVEVHDNANAPQHTQDIALSLGQDTKTNNNYSTLLNAKKTGIQSQKEKFDYNANISNDALVANNPKNTNEPEVMSINNTTKTNSNNAETSVEPLEPVKENVSLNATLRNITAQMKLQGREGLASMNEVKIAVTGDVALKVTDSRNKILKSGTFSKGDNIVIQGIPPIKIAVSDLSKVKIGYMGGKVVGPLQKQVEFSLPTK